MATSYDLIGSRPLVQVLSATAVIPVQVCTIRTKPSGVIADLWVSETSFKADGAAEQLAAFADNIETIIGQGKAVGGTGTTTLDNNGLQAVFVTFTVAYVPPAGDTASITTDVDVPVGLLSSDDPAISRTFMQQAEAMIDDAWNNLASAAGDQAATSGTGSSPADTATGS